MTATAALTGAYSQFELTLRVLANPLDRLHVAMLAKEWKAASSSASPCWL